MEKKNIIIIEDEFIIAQEIKHILDDVGDYNVFANINTYEKAIEAIENLNPHLVLIDIKIKSIKSGIDVGTYLQNKDEIPFIYITSFSDSLTLEKVKSTRPYGFIIKPFKDRDIVSTVFLTLSNYSHKNLDNLKNNNDIVEEVPLAIRNVISYINDNIYERIDIEELAKLTRWKKHHFLRIFAKEVGVTPYQYILKRKIDIAKSLIKETEQPINEIAYDLGFINYGNFSQIFKKFIKQSPESYKKVIQLQKKAKSEFPKKEYY
ncbi:DNA-binding response regulator [Flavobacterium sp.]|uniref:response regulator transcription factor n=1 Tax=Flavobacterium sp. TaxID=239 RepID=UPI00261123E4|nr:DNA-binding response regulator [Flavobacterium sp.]